MIDTGPQGPPAGALAGIVVADFSRVLAAPYATMLFGDLGADVIKIERPGSGDDTRHWGPPYTEDHEATYFLSVNRNKRSFTADMSAAADHDDLVELVRRADVLIENFRPGTMARHGLSYDQMAAINPRLVYCSITGFGSDDAAADLPGYDLLVQAVGGLMSVTGPAPGEPVKAGVALVDVLTGLHAAIGVLAALRARETTGRGQLVEVNLLGTLLSSMVNQSGLHRRGRRSGHPGKPAPVDRALPAVPRFGQASGHRCWQRPAVHAALHRTWHPGGSEGSTFRHQHSPRGPHR
jgi:crotonobetainyl-CoA:carnitine CoA-transferase CaiB-like acyl-CoA transferase